MIVRSYVPFHVEALFFLGTIQSMTSTQIVIVSADGLRKAVYGGNFSGTPFSPNGVIKSLSLYGDGALQAEFTEATWDAAAYFSALAVAVAGGPIQPVLDLVTAGDDTAIGSPFADIFYGGEGHDTVNARGGNDWVRGGPGRDFADGGGGDDRIEGGSWADDLRGGAGDDILNGDRGNDILNGGDGRDSLYGGGGRDTLIVDDADYIIRGGPGRDTLSFAFYDDGVTLTGSGGFLPRFEMRVWGTTQQISNVEVVLGSDYADCLYVNGFAQRVKARGGNDGVRGGLIDEWFSGGAGSDVLAGNDGNDVLEGGSQSDKLYGQSGRDTLNGGRGADILFGGRGADTLIGGGGRDVFVFNNGHGTGNEILDFEDGFDTINLGGVARDFSEVTVEDTADGALVSAGNISVLVRDVAADDLNVADFSFGWMSDYVTFPGCG